MMRGANTILWIADAREVPANLSKLAMARGVAAAVSRRAKLTGAAVRATDVEVVHNPVADDTVNGVLRLNMTEELSPADLAAAIIDGVRASGVPDAIPHVAASVERAGAVGALFSPITAAASWIASRVRGETDEWTDEQLAATVVSVRPGIDNALRPQIAATNVGARTAVASTRESDDATRNGSLGVQAAADAAREIGDAASRASALPSWLPYAGLGLATILVIGLSVGVARAVGGK